MSTKKRWIDNSIIYRKVLKSTGQTGSYVNIAHGISNLKVVCSMEILATNENGVNYFLGNSQYPVYVEEINGTNVVAGINNAYLSAPWAIYIILEYTKGV